MAADAEPTSQAPADAERETLVRLLGGRYAVIRLLGRGGMGAVHLVRDNTLQRMIAVKTLLARYQSDPERATTFRSEILSNARLAHPNIVPVYGIEERDGQAAMVMRYVHGESLGARLGRAEPMLAQEICRILADLASALARRSPTTPTTVSQSFACASMPSGRKRLPIALCPGQACSAIVREMIVA